MRDTSGVGEVSRMQVMAAVARLGKNVWIPLADIGRSDFAFEENGRFFRVQSKTGRLRKGVVTFLGCSFNSSSVPGRRICRPYTGEVEYFGVYCPDNNKVYLVPASEVPTACCHLRIDPPRNGQKTKLRWAREYEIGEGLGDPEWVAQTAEGLDTDATVSNPSESP